MFEERTLEQIRQSIFDKMQNNAAKVEGSYTSDVIAAVALEITKLYAYMNTLLSAMFPGENSGEYLHRRAADYGIYPKQPSYCTGTVTISAERDVTIPAGSTLISTDGVTFATTSEVAVAASGSSQFVPIKATFAGKLYIPADSLAFSPGFSGVSVAHSAIRGGSDLESDAALYKRLQLRLREPPACGTAADYRRWALEYPGIGYAKARKQNDGTILILIADDDYGEPLVETSILVARYINERRPLGAKVAVYGAISQNCSFNATVKLDTDTTLDAVRDAFRERMDRRLRELFEERDDLTLASVSHMLMSIQGVIDVVSLTINGAAANVQFMQGRKPTLGEVTINAV